jgi:hypothetical protein
MSYLKFDIRGNVKQGFNLSNREEIDPTEANDLMIYCEDVSSIKDKITKEHFQKTEDYDLYKNSKIFRDDTGYHFIIINS